MKLILAMLAALVVSSATLTQPVFDLADQPIVLTTHTKFDSIRAETFAFDSLRVVVIWDHPSDGLGNEDSTFFRIRATRTLRFMGGGSVAPETWRRRRWLTTTTADTFKALRPAVGDSIIFTADSIVQCRKGECSVPGSAAWGYKRTAKPPAMTFIKVTTDSF